MYLHISVHLRVDGHLCLYFKAAQSFPCVPYFCVCYYFCLYHILAADIFLKFTHQFTSMFLKFTNQLTTFSGNKNSLISSSVTSLGLLVLLKMLFQKWIITNYEQIGSLI
uniref:Uncharacterized protein n=1 Tax=Arundo donax TaxID=35708 RepID=A0A0A9FU96_ARUDO